MNTYDRPRVAWCYRAAGIVLYLVFAIAMLVFVPVDVATTAFAIQVTDFMANHIPMLNQIENIPGFRAYLRFYYATLWLSTPVAFLFGWQINKYDPQIGRNIERMSATEQIVRLLFFLACLWMIVHWPVSGSISYRDQLATSSIVGVVFFGFVTIVGITFLLGTIARTVIRLFILRASYS